MFDEILLPYDKCLNHHQLLAVFVSNVSLKILCGKYQRFLINLPLNIDLNQVYTDGQPHAKQLLVKDNSGTYILNHSSLLNHRNRYFIHAKRQSIKTRHYDGCRVFAVESY